ncbi:hypothetical protein EMIHUDRAFT_441254, partial [Emiliania huxleyi CCMP1516]|uniref:Uncharacterized protein n=2 Tax=Emiliania huxleyi TaxID=2903 RepID=A0A0D3J9D1_EMIH1
MSATIDSTVRRCTSSTPRLTSSAIASRPLGRCALVSSSDALLRYRFGDAIDSHDEIVRFNLAPVPEALHHHVGRRTTTVVVGYHVLLLLQESVARWLRQLQPLQPLQPPQHHQLQPLHADDNGGRSGSPQVAVLVSDNWCVTDDYKCRVPGKSRRWAQRGGRAGGPPLSCPKQAASVGRCRCIAHALPGWIDCAPAPSKEEVQETWRLYLEQANESCAKSGPSTGLAAAIHFLRRCKRVTLFGFGLPSRGGGDGDLQQTIG